MLLIDKNNFNYKHQDNSLLIINNPEIISKLYDIDDIISPKEFLKLEKIPYLKLIFILIYNKDKEYQEIFKRIKNREIIIYNHYPMIDPLPFDNFKYIEEKINKELITIIYKEENLEDIIEEGKIILIFSDDDIKIKREKIREIYKINEDINKTKFGKINSKRKTTFIIMNSQNIIPLPFDNIVKIYFHNFKLLSQEFIEFSKSYLHQGEIIINLDVSTETLPYLSLPFIREEKIVLKENPQRFLDESIKRTNTISLYPFIIIASILNEGKKGELTDINYEQDNISNHQICRTEGITKKIDEVYEILNKRYKIEKIDLPDQRFNKSTDLPDQRFNDSKELIEEIYKEHIYHLKDYENHIYTNNYKESKIINFDGLEYPKKIIKLNEEENIIFYYAI